MYWPQGMSYDGVVLQSLQTPLKNLCDENLQSKEKWQKLLSPRQVMHIQGVPYVLGRTLESLGPIMLTFWIFLLNYAKKQTFQWLIWCKLLFCSCTFIKDTGENVQHHFATLLYNLISKITIVIQTYKKSLNDQKWDLNWILGHWVQFWVLKR